MQHNISYKHGPQAFTNIINPLFCTRTIYQRKVRMTEQIPKRRYCHLNEESFNISQMQSFLPHNNYKSHAKIYLKMRENSIQIHEIF